MLIRIILGITTISYIHVHVYIDIKEMLSVYDFLEEQLHVHYCGLNGTIA